MPDLNKPGADQSNRDVPTFQINASGGSTQAVDLIRSLPLQPI